MSVGWVRIVERVSRTESVEVNELMKRKCVGYFWIISDIVKRRALNKCKYLYLINISKNTVPIVKCLGSWASNERDLNRNKLCDKDKVGQSRSPSWFIIMSILKTSQKGRALHGLYLFSWRSGSYTCFGHRSIRKNMADAEHNWYHHHGNWYQRLVVVTADQACS